MRDGASVRGGRVARRVAALATAAALLAAGACARSTRPSASVPVPTTAPEDSTALPATGGEDPTTTSTSATPSTTTPVSVAPRRTTTTTTVRPTTTTTAAQTRTTSVAGSSASFALSHNADGSVVRWNPCSVIHWRANVTGAPATALADVSTAFAQLAAATGMTFVFDGTTTTVPTNSWLRGTADTGTILVAWTTKDATDLFDAHADGEGGWYESGISRDGATWTWKIVRGFVVIDPTTTSSYRSGFGTGTTIGALVLHELGHAVGLDHVTDASQLMYPTLSRSTVAQYATGDLAGLTAVGRSAGCIV